MYYKFILNVLIKRYKMRSVVRSFQNYHRIYMQNNSFLKNDRSCLHISVFSHSLQRPTYVHTTSLTTCTRQYLEKSIEMDIKSGKGATAFEKLEKADDCALLGLSKRLWGSVFYNLNQNKEFEILDKIRVKTKDLSINCGEGALTTLIRSYVARNKPLHAVDVLDEIKHTGLLRHTRTYFPVITSLAENGHQNRAFQLFYEMQHHTFKSNKGITLSVPSDMVLALINSCFQSEISEYRKAEDVLLWYNHCGKPLTLEIFNVIKEWLYHDPANNWSIKKCHISEKGFCNNCGVCLNSGLPTSNKSEELKLVILNSIESKFSSKENASRRKKFNKYVTFLQHCTPCEIIIDGMSLGLSSNVDKRKKRFNFNTLLKVSDHFVQQGKDVLVLLNSSISPSFLSKDVQFFISDVGDDDLYIMYACATWNMAPFLVTRDKFREHRFLLAFHNHASYLKWIRSHSIKIGFERDTLTFHKDTYDPVVQKGNSSWHFPLIDRSWFCARKVI